MNDEIKQVEQDGQLKSIEINWDFLSDFVSDAYSEDDLRNYFGKVLAILKDRNIKNILFSDLKVISLPYSKSKIIKNNDGKIFAFTIKQFAGIFRKDESVGGGYEKNVNCFFCDILKKSNGRGMLTTDELPRYGISKSDKEYIISQLGLEDYDVGIMFCLTKDEAKKSYRLLLSHLKNIFKAS